MMMMMMMMMMTDVPTSESNRNKTAFLPLAVNNR